MNFSSEFRDSNYNQAHHQENLSNQESHHLSIHTLDTEQMTLKRLRQSL